MAGGQPRQNGATRANNWDRAGCLPRRLCDWIRRRYDHVHVKSNQFGHDLAEAFVLPFARSSLDDDVLAFDISAIAQPLQEGPGMGVWRIGSRHHRDRRVTEDQRDAVDLPGWLRPRRQLGGDEAASHHPNERASVHRGPPPDRPSRRDRANGRPSGANLPQHSGTWLGLLVGRWPAIERRVQSHKGGHQHEVGPSRLLNRCQKKSARASARTCELSRSAGRRSAGSSSGW